MTEALPTGAQSPGYFKEYALSRGLDPSSGAAQGEYTAALTQYRVDLAAEKGITLEELHYGPLADVGRLATDSFATEQPRTEAA